ncbi:MAG: hypothetical protein RR184_06590 [Citrobacter sp.]|uniref:lipase family alpha/beta hydrolase n=1 Tax=Citrobacter sp. TaxID=1896336 RepID=UPI002FC7265B
MGEMTGAGNATPVTTDAKEKDAKAVIYKIPDRVIPVVFLPGVMGSNLLGADSKSLWRLDSSVGAAWDWAVKGAEDRKRLLHYKRTSVDDGGKISEASQREQMLFLSRKKRKWGEAGFISYGEFLPWIQYALNDHDEMYSNKLTKNGKLTQRENLIDYNLNAELGEVNLTADEIALSYKYLFPVHGAGYNWLASNADSANELNNRITEIINDYNSRGIKCEKVILVTHSMGGFVARYFSENLNYSNKILGIVHGVMPTLGSPAAYRRMKAGEPSTAGMVLGNTGAKMTAVLAQSPGPLELLPGKSYHSGWLKIEGMQDGLPKSGNPFSDIYKERSAWWALCEDRFLNPEDKRKDKSKIDLGWDAYTLLIDKVERVINKLDGKFHKNTYVFYGCGGKDSDKKYREDYLSYTNIYWKGVAHGKYDRNVGKDLSVLAYKGILADMYMEEIEGSRTVVLATDLNKENWLKREYIISPPESSGDGTVPVEAAKFTDEGLKGMLGVEVSHEGAYKKKGDNPTDHARLFTLRSIIKIAQEVNNTTLAYK